MAGIGHNGGPDFEGLAWRTHCWQQARAKLLPVLPVEVVRMRVERARALGLDYKTYAGVRATTGRDIIAFLFSSNALRPDHRLRMARSAAERLAQIQDAERLALAQGLSPEALLSANADLLERAALAPAPFASFRTTAEGLRAVLGRLAGDQVVLVASDAPWEREWLSAGKLAALIPAERFLTPAA